MNCAVSEKDKVARQDNCFAALRQSRRSKPASGFSRLSAAIFGLGALGQNKRKCSTSDSTDSFTCAAGPKLNASPWIWRLRSNKRAPRQRYPLIGSSTCCQGRVALGCRKIGDSPLLHDRTQSGTTRSLAQSPPPMTLTTLFRVQSALPPLGSKEAAEVGAESHLSTSF